MSSAVYSTDHVLKQGGSETSTVRKLLNSVVMSVQKCFLMFMVFVAALAISCGRVPDTREQVVVTEEAPGSAEIGYSVIWEANTVPGVMAAGSTVPVSVTFRNTSESVWPDPRTANPTRPRGANAVRLGYRWWESEDGEPIADYQARADLPHALEPGRSQTLTMDVLVPDRPGEYRLQFDLVHELVAWFEGRGAPRLVVPVSVR